MQELPIRIPKPLSRRYTVETDAKPFKVNKSTLRGCLIRDIDVDCIVTTGKHYMRIKGIKLDMHGFIQEYHLVVPINKKTYESMKKQG